MRVGLRIAGLCVAVSFIWVLSCDTGKGPEETTIEKEASESKSILTIVVPVFATWARIHATPIESYIPLKVELLWPPDGLNQVAQPLDLSWKRVPRSVGYQVQVAGEPGFSKPTIDVVTEKATLYLKGSGGPLYWRVRAKTEAREGPWSEVWSFKFGR